MLKVSRASFYRWRTPSGPSPRAVRHAQLVRAVKDEYLEANGRAGRDQLTRMLNDDGTGVSAPTVGVIMREQGLRAVRTQAFKKSTVQDPQARTAHIENQYIEAWYNRQRPNARAGGRTPAAALAE